MILDEEKIFIAAVKPPYIGRPFVLQNLKVINHRKTAATIKN